MSAGKCAGVLSCSASSNVNFTNRNPLLTTMDVHPHVTYGLSHDEAIFIPIDIVGFVSNPAVVVDRQFCIIVGCLEYPDK